MTGLRQSWVETANDPETDFPLNNLPYGVFSPRGGHPRCGVAIGEMILDVAALEAEGILSAGDPPVFSGPSWNAFMELGPEGWSGFRGALMALLTAGSPLRKRVGPFLHPMDEA